MGLRKLWLTLAVAVMTGAAGMAGAQKVDPNDYAGAIKVDDLFIVDCLLPPQVRQMGQRFTYLAARKPIRTSAKDCAIRGGEYVAYDRADLETALKVWLPAAEGGDAQAQTYVGEMYEEGMGVPPDYAAAAKWYALAAEQGHPRAQINLGALYESGRGVSQDLTRAMNLYREASGITDGVLEYTTDEQMARRRALAQEAERLRAQVLDLTDRLEGAEKKLTRRKRDLRRARDELARTLDELELERSQSADLSAAERQALEQLRSDNSRLKTDLGKAQAARSALLAELGEVQEQSELAQDELSRVRGELDRREAAVDQSRQEVERLRQQLQTARSSGSDEADELAAAIEAKESALETERALIAARQEELSDALQAAEAQLKAARDQEGALRAQVSGQAEEIDIIRGSLAQAQNELMESQLKLAAGQGAAEELEELRQEIADREAEIAAAQADSDALLDQLLVQEIEAAEDVISMISPDVGVARGVRAVTLFSDVEDYDLIGRISPSSELLAFRVNDRNALDQIDGNGLFKVPVSLEGMETPVSIEAVTVDGERTRESFIIQKDLPQAIATRVTSRQFRKRLRRDLGSFNALVIGNNNYSHHQPLATATADARGVAQVLEERYGFNVSLLLDATQAAMVQEFARLTESLGKNDNLLIYYAGHGVVTDDGNGHWLGVDSAAGPDATWIGNNQISDFISEMTAKHVLVVADSCYSGTLSGAAIRPIPLEVDDQDLLFISRVRARTVLTSGGLQPVLDDGGDGNSIFGGAFIRAISGNADVMEGYRLFEAVEREVETRSRLAQLRQSPEYTAMKFAGHEGSEFFFLPESDTALARQPQRL
ncbi:MAG: caspase family protein [Pseudomonadota bacterium]